MTRTEAEELVLELLANAPSSFAALYGFVARQATTTRPSVKEISTASSHNENTNDGFRHQTQTCRSMHCRSTRLDCGQLLPDGHAEWARRASHKPVLSPWTVDLEPSEAAVVVHASDAESAHRALAEWLAVHPQFEIRPETSVQKAAASFQLRNGTVVSGGVQLRSQLLKRRSK